jgi:hypothetical protein
VKVVFFKEDKSKEIVECNECMVFDSIAVLKGIKDTPAIKSLRIPLFKVTRMETYE